MYSPFRSEFYVSQAYKGSGKSSPHRGIDLVSFGPDKSIYVPPNTPNCVVDYVGWENKWNTKQGYGYYVRLKATVNGRAWYLIMGHMIANSACVKTGQTVNVGDKLGTMGNTGASQFPHVHMEIRLGTPGVYAENENVAEHYGIPNYYDGMKHLKSDWPVSPETQKEVTGTGIAKSKDAKIAGTYIVKNGSWNFRNGASVIEKPLVVVHGGDVCQNYGYYTDTLGTRWLYCVCVLGNTKYTGFISSSAVKKN